MKLLIIRHGDPDYVKDSLTEQGWKEAECLAERLSKLDIRQFYVSPLGRAKDTASQTLKKMGRTAQECQWLREFAPTIQRPDREKKTIVWDWLPEDWTCVKEFYDRDQWKHTSVMKDGGVDQEYEWVSQSFDQLLAEYGYLRKDNYYQVTEENTDTLVFFTHFGAGCVLVSHLLGISPMLLWHGCCAAPSSVTTLVSEERRKGAAYFRMSSFGDISHLYAAGEQPSVAARFCECFGNVDERHD